MKELRKLISTPFHYTDPSERSGDSLSVRIVFPGLKQSEFEKLDLVRWYMLEVANFWEIFGEKYSVAFPTMPTHEYFGQLEEE